MKEIQLANAEKGILNAFISEFLPPTGSKRKYSGNEISYVEITLNKVFIQNFGFNLSSLELLNAFEELGYWIFKMNSTMHLTTKREIPIKKGSEIYQRDSSLIAPLIYIETNCNSMRYLRKTTLKLPADTNAETLQKTTSLKQEITDFKAKFTQQ